MGAVALTSADTKLLSLTIVHIGQSSADPQPNQFLTGEEVLEEERVGKN
jgi:hypothetical protein